MRYIFRDALNRDCGGPGGLLMGVYSENNDLDEQASGWYGYPVLKTSADFYMGWQGWTDGWTVCFYSNSTKYALDTYDKYLTADTWYYISGTYDSSSIYAYRNGASIGSAGKGDHDVDNVSTIISGDGAWDGLIDEVRISSTSRSADWIKFEYRNMAEADNELTFSSEEEAPQVSPLSNLIGNPYLFTGRRFDRETGLYYYRARYYDPNTGRFLQTDPIGYEDGMNWYSYCGNNPVGLVDSSGTHYYTASFNSGYQSGIHVELFDDDGELVEEDDLYGDFQFFRWAEGHEFELPISWMKEQVGWELARSGAKDDTSAIRLFWEIQLLMHMNVFSSEEIETLEKNGVKIKIGYWTDPETKKRKTNFFHSPKNTIYWNRSSYIGKGTENWLWCPPIATLAHELDHAYVHNNTEACGSDGWSEKYEVQAIRDRENVARVMCFMYFPKWSQVYPRYSYEQGKGEYSGTPVEAWLKYLTNGRKVIY